MYAVTKLRAASSVFRRSIGSVRNSGTWVYRSIAPPASRRTMLVAETVGALMWYWILWHVWHQPEHIYGHFPYPDPKQWTDEELGIPPDDAE